MRQKPWNKYEAVILLEAYIQVLKGRLDRKKSIAEVSKKLRQLAIYNSEEIDDVFRNEAEISVQMYSMESAFLGKTIRKPATQMFSEVVKFRKSDKPKYALLLAETRRMLLTYCKDQYQMWLIDSGMTEHAARNYCNWLNKIDEYVMDIGFDDRSVYECEDVSQLVKLYDLLSSNAEYYKSHRDYFTSFRKYIFYRSDGNVELGKRSPVYSTSENALPIKRVEVSTEERERLYKILIDHFNEGLVLNAIRLDKFRMLYEMQFEDKLSDSDDYLGEQLKEVGVFIDGRIYPRHGENEKILLTEIRKEIREVLENGACCVYISMVLQRWQQALAEQLNIYNETALRDLIISEDLPGVYATKDVFKMTQNKVCPDNDVVEFMKNSHSPVSYEVLKKKLWFIPIDYIKRVLVMTPSMVQVDGETYLYAPNFPASASELQTLVYYMNAKISEKGFLVSKDIAEIIVNNCPTIAINTEGYKDWAYRNVLRFVLQDYFEFGSSVISEKGKQLEMREVYRSFCRDHDHLSLNELKVFSDEVGVNIYWNDVLDEMVRISDEELIRRDRIHFDIEATDRVIDEICQGEYVPLKEIGFYLHFPPVDYPWNDYLLESYLKCSRKFELYHMSYSENGVYGVIVRKNSVFSDYRAVVVDMLARNNDWDDLESALALIVEKGYQARKRWTGFNKVVQEALLLREHILSERK